MYFIILCAARRHRLASWISAINLYRRRGEWNDRERHGGCVLNFSWFSMILKILSRNSKVAVNRTERCTLLHFILLLSFWLVRWSAGRCAWFLCYRKCLFSFYFILCACVMVMGGSCLVGFFRRCTIVVIEFGYFWCFFVRICCGRYHRNVPMVGERTIDLKLLMFGGNVAVYWRADWDKR